VERLENLQVTDDGCGTDDTLHHKGMLLHQGNVGENWRNRCGSARRRRPRGSPAGCLLRKVSCGQRNSRSVMLGFGRRRTNFLLRWHSGGGKRTETGGRRAPWRRSASGDVDLLW
jgi:hypothetical protein